MQQWTKPAPQANLLAISDIGDINDDYIMVL